MKYLAADCQPTTEPPKIGGSFQEENIESDPAVYEQLKIQTGLKTVPLIFINGSLIGGYSELAALDDRGELDQLLKGTKT